MSASDTTTAAPSPGGGGPRATGLHKAADYGLSEEAGEAHRSWDDTLEAIGSERDWWLGTTRPDGRPHVMPVWGLVHDGRIVFSTDPRSTKARNLTHETAVTLHLPSGADVVIVEGQAQAMDAVPSDFSAAYQAKYDVEIDFSELAGGVFEIVPTKAFTWDEGEFVETAARWLFD